jgi:hypothetical protein
MLLTPEDRLARVVRRWDRPDVILGGPSSEYESLARRDWLEPRAANEARWRVARRSPLGLLMGAVSIRESRGVGGAAGAALHSRAPAAPVRTLVFDDPRFDPVALAWAKAVLREGEWADGYARLVRLAGSRCPPGQRPGSALAALERGEAGMTPAPAPRAQDSSGQSLFFVPMSGWPEWVEGIAVVRGTSHSRAAHDLVGRLAEADPSTRDAGSAADELLVDLLGASLIDAREELLRAWSTLEAAGRPEQAETWLTQAPPWPPASVEKILRREANAMALLETLCGQIVPDADVRAWLLRSWIAPVRPIDDGVLAELAGAADGRLMREPRFRSWLRGEWTAWARQRYRRVARTSASEAPSGPGASPGDKKRAIAS